MSGQAGELQSGTIECSWGNVVVSVFVATLAVAPSQALTNPELLDQRRFEFDSPRAAKKSKRRMVKAVIPRSGRRSSRRKFQQTLRRVGEWRRAQTRLSDARARSYPVQRFGAVQIPRSDLLRRVLGSLRDHPHDNTAEQIASLLSLAPDTIEVALAALEQDGLARRAQAHWVLSRDGWAAARADDPYGDLD
jgi:hypothetical protein